MASRGQQSHSVFIWGPLTQCGDVGTCARAAHPSGALGLCRIKAVASEEDTGWLSYRGWLSVHTVKGLALDLKTKELFSSNYSFIM